MKKYKSTRPVLFILNVKNKWISNKVNLWIYNNMQPNTAFSDLKTAFLDQSYNNGKIAYAPSDLNRVYNYRGSGQVITAKFHKVNIKKVSSFIKILQDKY